MTGLAALKVCRAHAARLAPGAPVSLVLIWAACLVVCSPALADAGDPGIPISGQAVSSGASDVEKSVAADPTAIPGFSAGAAQVSQAFLLHSGSSWSKGDQIAPVPAGASGLIGPNLDSARWLAANYFNVARRIAVVGQPAVLDPNAEKAAYQLAIWSYTDGLLLEQLPQDSPVVRRAVYLAVQAQGKLIEDRSSVPAQVRLTLTHTQTFSDGERFVAHLQQFQPVQDDISGGLVTLRLGDSKDAEAGGRPLRVVETDADGQATFDVPSRDDLQGPLEATWEATMPPGTVVTINGQLALLFQAMSEEIESSSTYHSNVSTGAALSAGSRHILDWFNGRLPGVGSLFVGLLMFLGIPTLVAARHREFWKRAFVTTLAVDVLVLFGAAYAMARVENRDFLDSWAKPVQTPASMEPLPILWVAETSELTGEHPGFFSADCATDSSPRSSWLSARNRGVGQMIVLRLRHSSVITALDILPGWLEEPTLYQATAKPARLRLFTETGQVAQANIPPTYWSSHPLPVRISLNEPLRGAQLWIQVTRIEGDTKTYTAIAQVVPLGGPDHQTGLSAVIDPRTVQPPVFSAPDCSAS